MYRFVGNRYPLSGKINHSFVDFGTNVVGIDLSKNARPAQKEIPIAAPVFNHSFLQELGQSGYSRRSFMKAERVIHSHGQTIKDIFTLRYGTFVRYVDVVIYPNSNEETEVRSEPCLIFIYNYFPISTLATGS